MGHITNVRGAGSPVIPPTVSTVRQDEKIDKITILSRPAV